MERIKFWDWLKNHQTITFSHYCLGFTPVTGMILLRYQSPEPSSLLLWKLSPQIIFNVYQGGGSILPPFFSFTFHCCIYISFLFVLFSSFSGNIKMSPPLTEGVFTGFRFHLHFYYFAAGLSNLWFVCFCFAKYLWSVIWVIYAHQRFHLWISMTR